MKLITQQIEKIYIFHNPKWSDLKNIQLCSQTLYPT